MLRRMRLKQQFANGFSPVNLKHNVAPNTISWESVAMSSAKVSWKDVKPVLSGFSSTQLLGLVQDLYRLNEENASFMHARFLSEDTKQGHLAPYMTRIQ